MNFRQVARVLKNTLLKGLESSMEKLLKFEYRKLFKSKLFYVCMCISCVVILIGGMSVKQTQIDLETGKCVCSLSEFMLEALSFGLTTYIIGIFTAKFICEDDSFGTLKNIYARGYSRTNVFFAKYIVSLSAVLMIMIAELLVALLFGLVNFLVDLNNSKLILCLFGQLVVMVAYHSLFTMVSVCVKKTGGAIAINLIGVSLVTTAVTLVDVYLHYKEIVTKFFFSNYWIESLLSYFENIKISTNNIIIGFVGAICYTAVGICISYFVSRKKEV